MWAPERLFTKKMTFLRWYRIRYGTKLGKNLSNFHIFLKNRNLMKYFILLPLNFCDAPIRTT